MLIQFGLFSPNDNLTFIAALPNTTTILTTTNYLFSSPTMTIDTATAQVISVALTGNTSITLNYLGSTAPIGYQVALRFTQDATGGRVVTFPANLITDQGFEIDPAPSRTTVLPIQWNGTDWVYWAAPVSVTGA